ncbi:MAG: S8 family serine peptidase [Halobacteriales archaeon]
MVDGHITRRRVLRGVAAGVAATGMAGEAFAEQPDRMIVGLKPGASFGVATRRADEVHRKLDFEHVGRAVAGKFPQEALKGLENNPSVEYVEADSTYHALEQTLPWGIDRVDADVLHSDGETGNGADVAILDTGIDSDHPDLDGNLGSGKAFVDCGSVGGCRFGAGPNDNDCNYAWDDDNNHGTHCAGTADAEDNTEGVVGVSTEATLHAVKVLDGCGSGSLSDVAAGIEYVADQGWDVASMSLGASSGDDTLKNAVQYAYDKGVLLVGAAGNDGPCTDCVGYPAAYSEVIAVSSTASDDSLSDFSSTGPEVELAAPGTDIYSTVPGGYDTYSGTSMATPHVSGAGGQLMANGYTNTEARQQLQDTAEDIGLADNEQGYGLLDAEAAVSGGSDTDSAPSVSWVNPADGDTVSGTVTVQISASDSEDSDDSLTVEYTVDGGTARTTSYNSETGYYEDSWDTTTVDDGDHALEASATDSAGNTSSSSITVTTDNTESAPAVDSLSAGEVETDDSDAEFDVDWAVSDDDGDLSSVDLVLTDDTDGETEDSASISVSGSDATGTTRLVAAGDDGSGNDYTVEATATDSNGNTASDTTAVSETEDTSTAPTIDTFALTDDSNPAWTRYYVDWAASDDDGDLSSVTSEMLDSSGNVLDSASSSVSGSSASGQHYLESKSAGAEIALTVTDDAGNTTTATKSI